MKRALQYVAAELTLVNGRFERDMAVGVQDGVIVSVQPTSAVDSDSWSRFGTSSSVLRLPHRALIPGMVSSHSHAFQRALRGRGETYRPLAEQREDFWSWRQAMYAVVDEVSSDPSQFYAWTRRCFEEVTTDLPTYRPTYLSRSSPPPPPPPPRICLPCIPN